MKSKLRAGFEATCSGYSPDRVVADPWLNEAFLAECRLLGLAGSPATLNRALLNLRKRGELRGLRSKRSSFPDEDQYRFAAEISARVIERRDGVSLDDIICDPPLAAEFDGLAAQIAPGYSALEYRWAALNLRKARGLKPELLSRVVRAEDVCVFPVTNIDISKVPSQQGLYVFFTANGALYAGEAENLNNRIRKHLDHSDNKGLARWLWDQGVEAVHLEIQALPSDTSTRVRRALEAELIRSRDPLFNVKR
jgi:hypothetical protein